MPAKFSCPLYFHTQEPCARRGEPVTVGLPWPRGAITDENCFRLIGPNVEGQLPAGSPSTVDREQPLQTKVLDRWPDGSVRWCLFDFLATHEFSRESQTSETSGYRIEVVEKAQTSQLESPQFENRAGQLSLSSKGFQLLVGPVQAGLLYNAWQERAYQNIVTLDGHPVVYRVVSVENGTFRVRVLLEADDFFSSKFPGLLLTVTLDLFPSNNTMRYAIGLRNKLAADHPGGNWDLGSKGSVSVGHLKLSVKSNQTISGGAIRISPRIDEPGKPTSQGQYLEQLSSGGENWKSANHIDQHRKVPLETRGYIHQVDGSTVSGSRATPIAIVQNPDRLIGVTMPYFWQNFPKGIRATEDSITLELFPSETELQGGEQKTHTFYVAFGKDTITEEPMVWCRSPITVTASPEWYAASGAIPYLTPRSTDPHEKYLALVDLAIEGNDTFIHKREKIDEYGWRHFGEIYCDHEAVYHKGPTPLISHYNNQYDCIAAFFFQFFRSGDLRWLQQGIECADHTSDIDIYHTDGDKAAYNRGLFWHTYHYADADTGNHRSYPKSLRHGPVESLTQKMDTLGEVAKQLKKSYAVGGGPSSSHNYNAGLMLAYFLTGNSLYRESALDLANFVITMEDPWRTPFRFLSWEYTGLATDSGAGGYHGPGRAVANSVIALVVGHQLSGDVKYLAKAEQLIRRTVHPKQNIEQLNLFNTELRWFYTMTLQALGFYLDHKMELGQLDENYAYARLTLLHYARWMATNERPILDASEKLQYPTETWAAQDMRKVEVFQYAAKHAVGEDKKKFLERSEWFFDYVQNKLSEFETKSLCRPVILMMKYGWTRNWWKQNPTATAPEPTVKKTPDDFGTWRMFVPQKTKAIKRAKTIVVAGAVAGVCLVVGLLWWLLK
jgi:hypothetical protein